MRRSLFVVCAALAVFVGASACGDSGGNGVADAAVDVGDGDVLEEVDVRRECDPSIDCLHLTVGACEHVVCTDNVCGTEPDPDPCCGYVPPQSQPGAYFTPCETNAACFSGWCLATVDGRRCGRPCETSAGCFGCRTTCGIEWCVTGMSCKLLDSGVGITFVCASDDLDLCKPCASDAECRTISASERNLCIASDPTAGPAGRCARRCDETHDSPCPDGYLCQTVADAPEGAERQCLPASGTCAP